MNNLVKGLSLICDIGMIKSAICDIDISLVKGGISLVKDGIGLVKGGISLVKGSIGLVKGGIDLVFRLY